MQAYQGSFYGRMIMKGGRHGQGLQVCVSRIWPMIFCLFSFIGHSCEKVEIPMASDEKIADGGTAGTSPVIVITGTGEGTASCPYAVADILAFETFPDAPVWTAGYVVGYVEGSLKNAVFGAEGAVQSNILIADSPGETEVEACLPVELNTDKLHSGISLCYNPDSLGRYIVLQASVQSYFRVAGLRKVKQYRWYGAGPGFQPEQPEQPEEPDVPEEPEEPDVPEEPDDPDDPDDPEEPDTPEQPEEPDIPEQPDEPEIPGDDLLGDTVNINHEEQILDGHSLKRNKLKEHGIVRFGNNGRRDFRR